MVKGTKQFWEVNQVNLGSTTVPVRVATLHNGESIHIKAQIGNTGYVYIGYDEHVSTTTGYELEQGESIDIAYEAEPENIDFMEIWALPATKDDDLCFFKNIKFKPSAIGDHAK